MRPSSRWCLGLAILAVAAIPEHAALADTPVDLELVLAVDVSGSMDLDEQALQRQGYIAAILQPDVLAAIRSGPFQRVAITYVEWAGPGAHGVAVPWTLIEDATSAAAFAAALDDAPPARMRGTSISGALLFSAPLFEGNGFEGMRRVIDVSGDGPNNAGGPVVPARDLALQQGIVINGLPIALKGGGSWSLGGADLVAYYRDCVIGGPGAFVVPVTATDQFADAILQKLILEIAGGTPHALPAAARPVADTADCLLGERLRRIWERDP